VRLDFLYAVATKLQVGHLKRRSVTLVFRKVYQLLLFSLSILYYKKGGTVNWQFAQKYFCSFGKK
jgi:hypothetical protein